MSLTVHTERRKSREKLLVVLSEGMTKQAQRWMEQSEKCMKVNI